MSDTLLQTRFDTVILFPIVHERPSLGCRVLVQRNFSKILPAVLGDITDWVVETRVKVNKLFEFLILNRGRDL